VWDEVLDTEHVQVLRTYIELWPRKKGPEEKVLVIVVEPDEQARHRCPKCGQRGPVVETDVVRWRTLDVHGKRTFLEYTLPRIACAEHGKITAGVPWARPDDRFSRPFEEFAAWKAGHMAWTRAAAELRISWQGLAGIVSRVVADASAGTDRLAGLRRIGIDEKSWGRGSDKFLVIVTDHDTGRIAWVAEGRDQATVHKFFDALGDQRARLLTHVSADGADWIHPVVKKRAPQADLCLDAFHIVKWANEKLDELRTRTARELRAAGKDDQAATIGKGLWALRKKPTNLSGGQKTALGRHRRRQQAAVQGLPAQGATPRGPGGQGPRWEEAAPRDDRLGAPLPDPRVRQARQDPLEVPADHRQHHGPCRLQRPRRGTERPGQRPDHQSPRLPHRRDPDRRHPLHPRRPMPRNTLALNE
jgi:transposase